MELSLLNDYESPTISSFGFVANALDEIYVDDLRANNDPSLEAVPRINDFATLKSIFKLDVLTTLGGDLVRPSEKYFKLVGFYLMTGAAAFVPIALDENGNPLRDIFVWASWPTAPAFPEGVRAEPDYSENSGGVGGFTNENGDIGFGYGGDAVVKGDGGVYRIWLSADPPRQPRQRADCAIKLGWFGGTNHLTPNPIFQAVAKSGGAPPPSAGKGHYITVAIDGQEVWRGNLVVETTLRFEMK